MPVEERDRKVVMDVLGRQDEDDGGIVPLLLELAAEVRVVERTACAKIARDAGSDRIAEKILTEF